MTPHPAPSACACSSGSDVAQAEPNIHAGVKYIRYMVDHFCGKEPMTSLDKMSFAFAAYNAGPRRIQSMRREAAQSRTGPERLVQERRSRHHRESRAGDRDVRCEYLQVLHCVPTRTEADA